MGVRAQLCCAQMAKGSLIIVSSRKKIKKVQKFSFKFKHCNKCKIVDFVPKFQIEKGACAQICVSQMIEGNLKNISKKKIWKKFVPKCRYRRSKKLSVGDYLGSPRVKIEVFKIDSHND